jgi:hypothetical protein
MKTSIIGGSTYGQGPIREVNVKRRQPHLRGPFPIGHARWGLPTLRNQKTTLALSPRSGRLWSGIAPNEWARDCHTVAPPNETSQATPQALEMPPRWAPESTKLPLIDAARADVAAHQAGCAAIGTTFCSRRSRIRTVPKLGCSNSRSNPQTQPGWAEQQAERDKRESTTIKAIKREQVAV